MKIVDGQHTDPDTEFTSSTQLIFSVMRFRAIVPSQLCIFVLPATVIASVTETHRHTTPHHGARRDFTSKKKLYNIVDLDDMVVRSMLTSNHFACI